MIFGQSRNTLTAAAFPPNADMLRLHDGGCRWSLLNASRGVYNFARLDAHLAASEARGIPSLYVFCSTPAFAALPVPNQPWAIMGGTTNCPPDLTMFTEFVTAIVRHAQRPDGSLRIKAWELWNETNFTGFWCGTDVQLLAMAAIVHRIVKAADSTALVTTPTPCLSSTTVSQAMDRYLAAGLGQYADIVSFHGYCANGASALAIGPELDRMAAVMKKHGVSLPLWDTESGFKAPALVADDLKRQWVIDWVAVRRQRGLGASFWYQADNLTHGTQITQGGILTIAGQAWRDTYAACAGRLPAITNLTQVNP